MSPECESCGRSATVRVCVDGEWFDVCLPCATAPKEGRDGRPSFGAVAVSVDNQGSGLVEVGPASESAAAAPLPDPSFIEVTKEEVDEWLYMRCEARWGPGRWVKEAV